MWKRSPNSRYWFLTVRSMENTIREMYREVTSTQNRATKLAIFCFISYMIDVKESIPLFFEMFVYMFS